MAVLFYYLRDGDSTNGQPKSKLCTKPKGSQYRKARAVRLDVVMDSGDLLHDLTQPLLAHLECRLASARTKLCVSGGYIATQIHWRRTADMHAQYAGTHL